MASRFLYLTDFHSSQIVKRPLTEADWARFSRYAVRLHVLRIQPGSMNAVHDYLDATVKPLEFIRTYFVYQSPIPNLSVVHFSPPPGEPLEDTRQLIEAIQGLSPSMREIHVTLVVKPSPSVEQSLSYFASLASLRSLNVSFSRPVHWKSVAGLSSRPILPALRSLSLTSYMHGELPPNEDDTTHLVNLFHAIAPSKLTYLRVSFGFVRNVENLLYLCEAISTVGGNLRTCEFEICAALSMQEILLLPFNPAH